MTRADFIKTACAVLVVPGVSESEIAERKFKLAEELWGQHCRFGCFAGLCSEAVEFCDEAVLRQPSTSVALRWDNGNIAIEAALRYDIAIRMARLLKEKGILA